MGHSDSTPNWGELIDGLPETEGRLLGEVELLIEDEHYEQAEDVLDAALRSLPTPNLLKTQGRVHLERNSFQRGCSLLEPLCSGRKTDAEALLLYARGKSELGETSEAKRALDRAAESGAPPDLVEKVKITIENPALDLSAHASDHSVDHDEETVDIGEVWKKVVRATARNSEHGPEDRTEFLDTETFEPRDPDEYTSDTDPTVPERVQATENILGDRDIIVPADRSDTETEISRPDIVVDHEEDDEEDTEEADPEELFTVKTSRPTTDIEELLLETLAEGEDASDEPDTAEVDVDGIVATRLDVGDSGLEILDADPEKSRTVDLKVQQVSTVDRLSTDTAGSELSETELDEDVTAEARPSRLTEDQPSSLPSGEFDATGEVTHPEAPRPKRGEGPPKAEPPPEHPDGPEGGGEILELKDEVDGSERDRPWVGGGEKSERRASTPKGSWKPGHVLEDRSAQYAEIDSEPADESADTSADSPVESAELPARTNDRGSRGLRSMLAVLAGMAAVFGVVFVAAGTVTYWDQRSAVETEERVARAAADDTYDAWQQAHEIAAEGASNRPDQFRNMLHRLGALVLQREPADVRRRLARKQALAAAMLEYRFERCGSRNAETLIEAAHGGTSATPAGTALRIYHELACGDLYEAVDTAKKGAETFGPNPEITTARLAALLEAQAPDASLEQADRLLKQLDSPSVYQQYLLAHAESYRNSDSANDTLHAIAEGSTESPHLEAGLRYVENLVTGGENEDALEYAEKLQKAYPSEAPGYVRARLHNALGRAHFGNGDREKAREAFKAAIDAEPDRADVYLPSIQAALESGDLERAEQLAKEANSADGPTAAASIALARISHLRGHFKQALEALAVPDRLELEEPVLTARLYLRLERPNDARKALEAVSDVDPDAPVAEALGLLVSTYLDDVSDKNERNLLVQQMSALRDDNPDNAVLTRTAARLRVRLAHFSTGRERESHLNRALELARGARDLFSDRVSERGEGLRLLCEVGLAAGAPEATDESCQDARNRDEDSIEAARLAIRAALVRGDLERAADLLDDLPDGADDYWETAALRLRVQLRSFDFDRAESLLEDWKTKSGEDPLHQLLTGHLAFERGKYVEAAKRYQNVGGNGAATWEAKLFRAHALVRTEQFEPALELVRQLTDTVRWKADAWYVFAELRRRQGRAHDALENFRLAKRFYRDTFETPRRRAEREAQLALVWRDIRDWNDRRVLRHLEAALDATEEDIPEVSFVRGLYHRHKWNADPDLAAEFLQKTVGLQPFRCEAIDALAEVYRALGNASKRKEVETQKEEHCES